MEHIVTQQQLEWIQRVVEKPDLSHEDLATFLIGLSKEEFAYSEKDYAFLSYMDPVSLHQPLIFFVHIPCDLVFTCLTS